MDAQQRAAMKLALEALIWTTGSGDFGEGGCAYEGAKKCLFPAITALKEALAQPEQQPHGLAAYVIGCFSAAEAEGLQEALAETTDERLKDLVERRLMYALYEAQNTTPPQPKEPEQEPVAITTGVYGGRFTYVTNKPHVILPDGMGLYAAPQHKPLTLEQIEAQKVDWFHPELNLKPETIFHRGVRAAEAAHGIKE